MIISVLSGKGGTGKTTVAANLAYSVDGAGYVDCDVEEPNGFLFLKPEITKREKVDALVPSINQTLCEACGKCSSACQFNALAQVREKVLTFSQLCHSCGLCSLLCPVGAIQEVPREIGIIEEGCFDGHQFLQGVLNTGEPMAVPVIKQLKKTIVNNKKDVLVLDCPPGSSCSVIAGIEHSDFCVLVTEPTPFGLHDLAIAMELVNTAAIPCGVVVNKSDSGSNTVKEYCAARKVPVLMEIPFSKKYASMYSAGQLLVDQNPELKERFIALMQEMRRLADEAVSYCKW